MLAWTIYLPLAAAVALLLARPKNAEAPRWLALLTTLATVLISVVELAGRGTTGGNVVTITKLPWIPQLGIQYFLAADGISVTLVLLTAIAAFVGILFSWNITHRAAEFFALYLLLIGGVFGVFLSFDLFLLFAFYELAIIPKYFLIAIWGSTNREYGAMKLVLYSFLGSALVLISMIAVFGVMGTPTFDMVELAKHPFGRSFQLWVFPMVFVGFAVLAGMWPFHTWAPTGHVAAPTAASMLLAGVVMKLGAYGALRVGLGLFPEGARYWGTTVATLAVIGIVYGALVALVQRDFKFVIGYSSVSHMGFVMLGLASLNFVGMAGAVLQMFSHGIIAGLLFGVVGRMVYDRTHTRDLDELEKMSLAKAMPYAAAVFGIATFASMGMPGFSGFVAEMQVLVGAWQASPTLAVLAGLGILVGVGYSLRALQRAFLAHDGDPEAKPAAAGHGSHHALAAITFPEKLGAILLIGCSLVVGLYPAVLLDLIVPALKSPFFHGLTQPFGR